LQQRTPLRVDEIEAAAHEGEARAGYGVSGRRQVGRRWIVERAIAATRHGKRERDYRGKAHAPCQCNHWTATRPCEIGGLHWAIVNSVGTRVNLVEAAMPDRVVLGALFGIGIGIGSVNTYEVKRVDTDHLSEA
jgi:hypothetical protein